MFQNKLKEKDINLLDVYAQKSEPSKYEGLLKYALPPLIIAVLFGSVFGYFKVKAHFIGNDLAEINEEIDKLIAEQEADGKQEKYALLQSLKQQLQVFQTAYQTMNSYPQISKTIINGIFTAASTTVNVESLSFTQDSSIIGLNVKTPYLSETDNIIRRLKQTNLFEDVVYTGYTSEEITEEVQTNDNTVDTSNMTNEEKTAAILAGLLNNNTQSNTEKKVIGRNYVISISCTLKKEVTE